MEVRHARYLPFTAVIRYKYDDVPRIVEGTVTEFPVFTAAVNDEHTGDD